MSDSLTSEERFLKQVDFHLKARICELIFHFFFEILKILKNHILRKKPAPLCKLYGREFPDCNCLLLPAPSSGYEGRSPATFFCGDPGERGGSQEERRRRVEKNRRRRRKEVNAND